MVSPVVIAGRPIGPGQRCFITAEAGVNHDGHVEMASRLIDAAATAGADAVKFQTFSAERLVSPVAPKAAYQREATGASESQLAMIQHLELPRAAYPELQAHARSRGVLFLSTPFDEESADFLEALGVPAFKIGSGEITNLPFLAHVARKAKPVILSTGMSDLDEVATAVEVLRQSGNDQLVLLHCVSSYPAAPADVNLRAMQTMADTFHVPVGYSDHTEDIEVALAAVALGACVIEKHLTLDRAMPGPDHRASAEPQELARLVESIRTVEVALGDGRKQPTFGEADTAAAARKSLVAALDIAAGTRLTERLIAIKRPGTGLSPAARPQLVGRTAKTDIAAGTVLTWGMLE
ncbi:MAG: N-acetylneuraminate synthase [Candidatus Omnitrophota bacterium]|nr:N-acetylneuraminate synthase [Candidatus Omnitrophota bacterium]